MKKILTLCLLALMVPSYGQKTLGVTQPNFDTYFIDMTLRMDYFCEGNRQWDTTYLFDNGFVVEEGRPWSGSLTQLLDPIDNGDYRILVKDRLTGTPIYSRTYNTLFREYRDTPAGKDSIARFEEVFNMPLPKGPVVICMQQRDDHQKFYTKNTFVYDPSIRRLNTLKKEGPKPIRLSVKGDSHVKIDIAIVAEGYGPGEREKMMADFAKFKEYLLGVEPFKSRKDDFNVWGVPVFGEKSGLTDPNKKIFVNSAVGASYNTFGADRYLMTPRLFQLHDMLSNTPCDHIIIMANSIHYGGGAIYNFYAISSLTDMAYYVLPHELGHSIGGLADEYVDTQLAYNDMHKETTEPVEPNITTLVDFDSKWKSMLDPSTPIPTPVCTPNSKNENCGPLGVYEGGGYKAKGVYRPVVNCMMNYYAPFCPVCSKALNTMFDLYTK